MDTKFIPKCASTRGHYENLYIRRFGEVVEDLLAAAKRAFTIDSLETDFVVF